MKKILLIVSFIFSIYLFINLLILPNIDYSKIEYVSYSSEELQSMELDDSLKTKKLRYINMQVQLKYDAFSKQSGCHLDLQEMEELSHKDRKALQREHRIEAKEYHKGNNSRILDSLIFGNFQDIYVSNYAPFIDVSYNLEYFAKHQTYILEQLSKNKLVAGITISVIEEEYHEEIASISNQIGAGDVYTNRTRTGSGVVVGVLESGVIDTSHPDLQESIIITRSHVLNSFYVKDHATNVALIIAGSNGLANDVVLLNALLLGSLSEEVEWMLDNDVDIINMSFGEEDNHGEYSSMSAYVDYIMAEEYVIIVNSAGNEGRTTGYITNPGLAYNVLTVGSVDYDNYRSRFSSHVTLSGPEKPTISLYGEHVSVYDDANTSVDGTSFSAALMSGYLAWIIQSHSTLLVNRERLYALLVANAHNSVYIPNTDCGFANTIGAGVFNYANLEANYSYSGVKSNSTGVTNTLIYSKEVYLQAGQTLRASLATTASSDGTVNGVTFTDYDLQIKNSSGQLLFNANSVDSVIEVATYTATTSGYYTFNIVQVTERVKNKDYIGYAYRIY